MSRNGAGTYTLPAGNPVTTGTVISSTWANTTLSDIGSALTQSVAKDGQTTMTANLPMGGFKLTNTAAGSAATDSVNLGQVQNGAFLTLSSVSGTDTITATASPTLTAYGNGKRFSFISAGANTGVAVTLNVDGLGSRNITKLGATPLAIGDIPSGAKVLVEDDGTQFQLLNLAAQTAASISSSTTAVTQSIGDNSTKIATTAYADRYGSRIQTVGASVAANAMTITLNPTVLDFRSTTAGSGTINTVAVPVAISTVISSGSTAGAISGVQSDIIVAAIDTSSTTTFSGTASFATNVMTVTVASSGTLKAGDAITSSGVAAGTYITSFGTGTGGTGTYNLSTTPGTITAQAVTAKSPSELAWCNADGGLDLSETVNISTTAEGGAGAADSASTWYSTTARSNVAYRIVGVIRSTQATAGSWATAPSLIQGNGGRALQYQLSISPQFPTTSGTSIDTTGLPVWARKISINLNRVSTNAAGGNRLILQVGSGSVTTSGYETNYNLASGASVSVSTSTVGYVVMGGVGATDVISGSLVLYYVGSYTWMGVGNFTMSTGQRQVTSMGTITLSSVLDRVRLTTEGGTDTFDAGSYSVWVEGQAW